MLIFVEIAYIQTYYDLIYLMYQMKERKAQMNERLNIDVNKLPLETYAQLIMIRAVNNLDTLEDAIVMLANYFWNDEREDD